MVETDFNQNGKKTTNKSSAISMIVVAIFCFITLFFIILNPHKNILANGLMSPKVKKAFLDDIQKSISKNQMTVDLLSKTKGSEIKESRIVFNKYIPASEIKTIADKYQLTIREIHIGFGDNKAGYAAKNNETLDDMIRSAKIAHEKFLDTVLSIETQDELLTEFRAQKDALNKYGLTVFGFDGESQIVEFKKLKDENRDIRYIEIKENIGQKFSPPLSPSDLEILK